MLLCYQALYPLSVLVYIIAVQQASLKNNTPHCMCVMEGLFDINSTSPQYKYLCLRHQVLHLHMISFSPFCNEQILELCVELCMELRRKSLGEIRG